MVASSFEARVRQAPGMGILDLQGQIDANAEPGLSRAYDEATRSGPSLVLLNFTAVDYINSTGIALIVSLLARARKERRQMVAFGLSDHYREIFEITRLVDFMSIFADEASALGGQAPAVATAS